ncbi:MAG TPA: DUF3300 domain-containing protein [Bryobacteraceae bacterium]|jgi:hypothetical protein|nr:DUF3300 domain-containing protein [Bryobacteraceae bacterium]
MIRKFKVAALLALMLSVLAIPVSAQPVALGPEQLDRLVSRIALYPDPLLAQVLTASTFPEQIPDADRWADDHSYLHGEQLAKAIQDDHLPWDPSVLALLPFPSVLDPMSRDMAWTRQLGDAVLAQRPEVMEAVQRMRRKADEYGYLVGNQYVRVARYPGYIEILPADPAYIYVPVYDPVVVFARPAGRVAVSAAISWGPPVWIGTFFVPFGWAKAGFVWPSHEVLVAGQPWRREWITRSTYAHPYAWVRPVEPRVERHEIRRAVEARRRH